MGELGAFTTVDDDRRNGHAGGLEDAGLVASEESPEQVDPNSHEGQVATHLEAVADGDSTQVSAALEALAAQESSEVALPTREDAVNYAFAKAGLTQYKDLSDDTAIMAQAEQSWAQNDEKTKEKKRKKLQESINKKNGILDRFDRLNTDKKSEIDRRLQETVGRNGRDAVVDQNGRQREAGDESRELTNDELKTYVEAIFLPTKEVLKGQEGKLKTAESYITQLVSFAAESVAHIQDPAEQRAAMQEYVKVIQAATDAITFQDVCASRLTVGDHGWNHLNQDFRDSVNLYDGSKRDVSGNGGATAKEKLMLGLAAAYHDIGYTNPDTHDGQKTGSANYALYDSGHPITSAAYLELSRESFGAVLSDVEFSSLTQIVFNHENPENAERAGAMAAASEYFAISDATAAFGNEKLPPILSEVPESIGYVAMIAFVADRTKLLNALSTLSEEERITLINQINKQRSSEDSTEISDANELVANLTALVAEATAARDAMRATLENDKLGTGEDAQFSPTSAEALRFSLDHFSPMSLKFTLGRLSGEMIPPWVNKDKGNRIELTVCGGVAKQYDAKGYFTGAEAAATKLAVKVFGETSATPLSDEQADFLQKKLLNPDLAVPPDVESIVDFEYSEENGAKIVTLVAKTNKIALSYKPTTTIDDTPGSFVGKMSSALEQMATTRDQLIVDKIGVTQKDIVLTQKLLDQMVQAKEGQR